MWKGCEICQITTCGSWNKRRGWDFVEKNNFKFQINEEWRVEKSKESINMEGDFFCGGWNFSKLVSVER